MSLFSTRPDPEEVGRACDSIHVTILAQSSVKPKETVYSHVVDRKVGVMGIFRTVATFILAADTQRITNGPGVPSGERVMVIKEKLI